MAARERENMKNDIIAAIER